MTTTPQAALLSAQNPLLKRCYTMSEPHLSGYRVVIGFERLEDAQDAHEYIAKLQATQEPVQAGELPALPHDGWPARFRCDSCDGNGEIGELISMGHFQPPERQTCPDCGGRGWSDEGPAFSADHMRDYARAVLSARKPLMPLSSKQVKELAASVGYYDASAQEKADFINGIRHGERAHGIGAIGLEVKP